MKKRPIVAESARPAKTTAVSRAPGPIEGATFVTGAAAVAQLPTPGPAEIAFAGRSNAGKSSAINALARMTRLAYASRTPGRTQQINFFRLRGGALITDLPGYGYAAVPRALKEGWQDFLWTYVTTRDTLVGLVLVVDARHGLKPPDLRVLAAILPSGRPALILATKIDKLNQAGRRTAVAAIRDGLRTEFPAHAESATVIGFSATARIGLDDADRTIAHWIA